AGRSEFYTAYTPYQAEASQGSLQAFFEFQTLICQLTGLDVANASLYEGGSAVAEAVVMAMTVTGRAGKVVVADSVHPEYRRTLTTYLANLEPRVETLPTPGGFPDPGNPRVYGGRYLGLLACREQFVRKRPGRLVGQTVDRNGKRCWVLTLQTREQHIRREKATRNICTNQGLFALRAAVYLTALGPQGLKETAELCLRKAHYLAEELKKLPGVQLRFARPFFKEFVVQVPKEPAKLVEALLKTG